MLSVGRPSRCLSYSVITPNSCLAYYLVSIYYYSPITPVQGLHFAESLLLCIISFICCGLPLSATTILAKYKHRMAGSLHRAGDLDISPYQRVLQVSRYREQYTGSRRLPIRYGQLPLTFLFFISVNRLPDDRVYSIKHSYQ